MYTESCKLFHNTFGSSSTETLAKVQSAKIGAKGGLSLNRRVNMFLGSFLVKINPFSNKQMTKEHCAEQEEEIGVDGLVEPDIEKLMLNELPLLKSDSPGYEQEELFVQKLQQCCVIYNFKYPDMDVYEKNLKIEALNNMLNYIVKARNILTDRVHEAILQMVSHNLFRSLSCNVYANLNRDPNDPILDESWPHLEMVYNVFLSFLESDDLKTSCIEHIINDKFVLEILKLCDSSDPRERSFIKWAIFHVYCKFPGMRQFIEQQINNIIYEFIYTSEDFNGINELLWVMSSIFEHCILGVDEERREYLLRVLLPLHKVSCVSLFFSQLVSAIELYVAKDSSLIEPILSGIIRYWPKTCTHKEVMFIDAIDDYLGMIGPLDFEKIAELIFMHIARVVKSSHTEVADHALNLFTNRHILSLIRPHNSVIMSIMLPALIDVSKDHWSPSTLKRAHIAMEFFLVSDSSLFYVLMTKHKLQKELKRQRQRERDYKWKKLEEIAISVKDKSTIHSTLPQQQQQQRHGDGL